jgi:integral membrane protein
MTTSVQTKKNSLDQNASIGSIEYKQLKRLEKASIVEATTLILLVFIAVPLRHFWGWPYGSKLLGPIHGIAFLAYLWTALQTVAGGGWHNRETLRLFAVAFLPFGGYLNIRWLRERARAFNDIGQA